MKKLLRFFIFPFGLLNKILFLANEGSRDIENKLRFINSIIDKGSCFNSNVILHPKVHIYNDCLINNSVINSYTYVGKNCKIQNAHIGKFCSIANDVIIGPGRHPIDFFSTSPIFYKIVNPLNIKLVNKDLKFDEYLPVKIGNDVWIGTRSIIMDGVVIGNGSIIAANSVVTKNVESNTIVGGIPARFIKFRNSEDYNKSYNINNDWWDLNIDDIISGFKL
jgi:acetyltransferase-like isoleucine patch superfamily enzyme